MTKRPQSIEELLKKVEDQEVLIEQLKSRNASLKHFEILFEESLDFLCICGLDGYFVKVNPVFIANLGYSEQEFISKPIIDFVHPEDLEKTNNEIEKISKGTCTMNYGSI